MDSFDPNNKLQFSIHFPFPGPFVVKYAYPMPTIAKTCVTQPKSFTSTLASPLILSKPESYKHALIAPKWKLVM